MAFVLNDRVKETTTSTGTGTINLAGAETGFETFVAGVGNSNTCYYCIAHQSANEFEVGLGTVTDATPDTLARTTVISSSNSDSAVDFSAGTKDVFCTLPASKAVAIPGSGDLTVDVPGTIILDSSQNVNLYANGTHFAYLQNENSDFRIGPIIQDKDFIVRGNDGGTYLDGLTIDFSDAGAAIFNNSIRVGQSSVANLLIGNNGDVVELKAAKNGTDDIDMAFHTQASGGTLAERMRINADGNVGIGSAPPTTIRNDIHATEKALQVGRAAMLFSDSGLTTDLQNNSHLNNSDQRVAMTGTLGGTLYGQYNGVHTWYTAAAVAAPNVQSMTARMALDISGNLVVDNNITAYGTPSDIKLKENIEVIDNAVDKVKQLKGITYTLKSDGNRLTGLIAQDLEKVLPEAVYTAKDLEDEEHLAIRYGNTVGLLVEAIKELEARVKELEDK